MPYINKPETLTNNQLPSTQKDVTNRNFEYLWKKIIEIKRDTVNNNTPQNLDRLYYYIDQLTNDLSGLSGVVAAIPPPSWDNVTGKPYKLIDRQLPLKLDSTIEIAEIDLTTYNNSSLRINSQCSDEGYEFSTSFSIENYLNDTNGEWKLVYPDGIRDSFSSQTMGLEVCCTSGVLKTRARLLLVGGD